MVLVRPKIDPTAIFSNLPCVPDPMRVILENQYFSFAHSDAPFRFDGQT